MRKLLFVLVAVLLASCEEPAITPTPGTPAPHLSVGIEGIITMEAKGGDVAMTMVGGKVLYQNGSFPTIDLKAVVEELMGYAIPKLMEEKE